MLNQSFRHSQRVLGSYSAAVTRLPCFLHCSEPANGAHQKRSISSIVRIGTEDPRMSKIVVHDGTVYISGQTDATAEHIEGQTRNVLSKVDSLLQRAGTSKSNLITANIWLKNISRDFGAMNAVWNGWVDPDNKPVRATVEAAMARRQLLIEVQVTATTGQMPE
uniref:Uncharacterized protein n=1 Tax=Odontella aurita TaxID=265563 RepID=A0A7S4MZQ7_9STRA|mmetsp:Transcript_41927/g.127138  ORF Transcript_41927/g.127138 Transcript_41927/m.127138 type:complete len:164 (+) Transcript_41927:234-725(+)